MRVGERPEHQIHFLGAAVPGAIAQAPAAHSQIFTGVVWGSHERVVSGDVSAVFSARQGRCHPLASFEKRRKSHEPPIVEVSMSRKKAAPPPKEEWVDPDDAPELTDEWFRKAHVYHGDILIRRGEGPTWEERLAQANQEQAKRK
jgi:hypothetical protein